MSEFPATFDIAGVTYSADRVETDDKQICIEVTSGDVTQRFSPSYSLDELKHALGAEKYNQQIGMTNKFYDGANNG